ncbi:RHS repeat domain-containing protein [Gilliamella sp. Pas-s25]|uniref:RHS repeat domain-containing protein n=1 Tax=Gilliamella sp. Pas-s25 TaxID=2687310 RepID=UPI0013663EF2|nr:RHS repeat-associated core domain-containing protein [Gilliamella sp. Pas-s25]
MFQTNLWQDHKLIAECADNDKFWRSYIYEPDSHRPLAQILGKAGQSEKLKTYWYQNNYLGTPHRLTDSLGDTVYECEYSAYGEITYEHWPQAENNIKPINPLRFQGQYFDEETGLHYNINRYYDPFTGRYITQDPLGILGGLNSYQYAGSDPINWVDPLGLIKIENNGFEGIAGKKVNDTAAETIEGLDRPVRLPNADFPPNQTVTDALKSDKFKNMAKCSGLDCSEIAEKLLNIADGRGKIIEVRPKNKGQLNVFENGRIEIDQYYHQVYTDNKYIYDIRLSSQPIPKGDWKKHIKAINPDGVIISNKLYGLKGKK